MQERIGGGSLSSFAELPQKGGVTALCYTCQGGSLTCPFAWRCAFVLTGIVQAVPTQSLANSALG